MNAPFEDAQTPEERTPAGAMSGAQAGALRPPEASLEGYAWLPRMLDKARAELAGVQTGFPFACPVDHTCMARLRIGPELVRELVARHGTDDAAILAELRARGIPPAEEAWFDAPALENALQHGGPYLRVRRADELPDDQATGGRVFVGEQHEAGLSLVVIAAPAPTAPHAPDPGGRGCACRQRHVSPRRDTGAHSHGGRDRPHTRTGRSLAREPRRRAAARRGRLRRTRNRH